MKKSKFSTNQMAYAVRRAANADILDSIVGRSDNLSSASAANRSSEAVVCHDVVE